jgi:Family of unknown function (DUF6152)
MRHYRSVAFLLASVLATSAVLAHHSAVAEYDLDKPVSISGTIKRVEWQNPHIWYYLDVKEKNGSVSEWGVSGGAPGQLMRRGITKDVLKIGAVVSVEGFLARDGSKNMTGRRVTFADGNDVFTAGPEQQR